MLGDTYQADTDRAVRAMITQPELPKAPEPKTSVWSAPFRAIPAATAEAMAGLGEVLKGYGEVMAATDARPGGMFSTDKQRTLSDLITGGSEEERARQRMLDGIKGRNQVSDALRDVSDGYRPDPATASTAENLVFSLTKGLGKAVGYTALAGPFGAGLFGIDEGLTATDDLQRKGVDDATAAKVGALTGVAGAASVLAPVVGPTVGKTVGLALAGGPGAYIAQQAATREILREADYPAIAEQYDPLDPVGLTVATLIPAAFAGVHIRGLTKTAPKVSPEAVDAAMTHNLTLQQDARAGAPDPVLPLVPPVRDVVPRADDIAPPKPAEDAAARVVSERVEVIEAEAPDLVVRKAEDGALITAKQELERIRREIDDGTDTQLGRLDGDLVKLAAECALSSL